MKGSIGAPPRMILRIESRISKSSRSFKKYPVAPVCIACKMVSWVLQVEMTKIGASLVSRKN